MAYRHERLEKQIERCLSNVLVFDAKDGALANITITKVTLTRDYSYADILWSYLGGQEKSGNAAQALENAKGYLRTKVAQEVEMFKAPILRFRYDDAFERGLRIEAILASIKPNQTDNSSEAKDEEEK